MDNALFIDDIHVVVPDVRLANGNGVVHVLQRDLPPRRKDDKR